MFGTKFVEEEENCMSMIKTRKKEKLGGEKKERKEADR